MTSDDITVRVVHEHDVAPDDVVEYIFATGLPGDRISLVVDGNEIDVGEYRDVNVDELDRDVGDALDELDGGVDA